MGRWVLFLINKVFHFAEFVPFLTELVAVIFFYISVALWCVVFKKALNDEFKSTGYTIFACVFISSPILSEILTYYTYNGICTAYGAAATVLAFLEGIRRENRHAWRCILLSGLLITIVAGCYESMIFVYATGVILVYILLCVSDKKQIYYMNLSRWLVCGMVSIVLLLIFRTVIVEILKLLFQFRKPVIFVGRYEILHDIVEDACLELNSEEFSRVRKLADNLDEHLKEKYYQNGYYCFAETPFLSVLKWGVDAFDTTNIEIWEMHGHSFIMEKDLEKYQEAQQYSDTMPTWPQDGFIQETENCIVVKLGN